MPATSMALIRKQYCGSESARGVLELLTPTLMADKPFGRFKPATKEISSLANGSDVSSGYFRKYQWQVTSDSQEPETLQDPALKIESVSLVISYPVLPALYGLADLDSMEDVIRSDARQLRDALLSPGNLIAGCQAVMPTIKSLDRQEKVWFQTIECEVIYYETQTLT